MSSVYNVDAWSISDTYRKHAIVSYNNGYYYALSDLAAGLSTPDISLGSLWGGYQILNSDLKPHFFWVPTFNSTINNQPKTSVVQFGNGFQQRTRQGLNNLLVTAEFSFEHRTTDEAKAIVHFLNQRGGVESFLFLLPEPYSSTRKFICKSFPHTEVFHNNHSIKATFEEVVE
jgi:phage-related protein